MHIMSSQVTVPFLLHFFFSDYPKKGVERYKVWQNVRPAEMSYWFLSSFSRFFFLYIVSAQIWSFLIRFSRWENCTDFFLAPRAIKKKKFLSLVGSEEVNWTLNTLPYEPFLSFFNYSITGACVSQQVRELAFTEQHGGLNLAI